MVDFMVHLVDDETDILESLSNILSASGYGTSAYRTVSSFLAGEGWKKGPGAALVDLSLEGESGLDALRALAEKAPGFPSAVISGTSEIRLAVKAIQAGAREFFEKPLEAGRILAWLSKARAASELECERRQLLSDTLDRYMLVGSSPEMAAARAKIAEYAPLSETVLVHGETGTGKELAAAQLHYLSQRRARPFRAVNIAALPADLMESQLFGHLKGSFSGATERNEGLIIASRRSTLFLDEIGELPREAQAKLLRVLQDREVLSLGSTVPEKVDVRFVCATNRDLLEESSKGAFRRDLYYRVALLSIEMPPLRRRPADIPEIADYFLDRFSREYSLPRRSLGDGAADKLSAHPFPGNVRELQSVLLRAAMESRRDPGDRVAADRIAFDAILPPDHGTDAEGIFMKTDELGGVKRLLEKRYIETQLSLHGCSVPETANGLGLLPSNLYRRMRILRIGEGR